MFPSSFYQSTVTLIAKPYKDITRILQKISMNIDTKTSSTTVVSHIQQHIKKNMHNDQIETYSGM